MNEQNAKTVLNGARNGTRNGTKNYLIAIVSMVLIAVIALVAVTIIRPDQDNSTLYVLILSSIGPTTLGLLALMKSTETVRVAQETHQVAQETHLSVNSRLDQFIRNADRSARAEGELAGLAAGREQADQRTDTLKEKETTHEKKP